MMAAQGRLELVMVELAACAARCLFLEVAPPPPVTILSVESELVIPGSRKGLGIGQFGGKKIKEAVPIFYSLQFCK